MAKEKKAGKAYVLDLLTSQKLRFKITPGVIMGCRSKDSYIFVRKVSPDRGVTEGLWTSESSFDDFYKALPVQVSSAYQFYALASIIGACVGLHIRPYGEKNDTDTWQVQFLEPED
jgi:hypothetical protein